MFLKQSDKPFAEIDEKFFVSMMGAKLVHIDFNPITLDGEIDEQQINDISSNFGFISHDRVDNNENKIDFSRLHSHPDVEARWTIAGKGAFFIPFGKSLMKVIVEKGDFIIIQADVFHWYEYIEEPDNTHSVIRFFQNEERITNYQD